MSGLRRRVEELENRPRIEPTPPPQSEEARTALADFQAATVALKERAGAEKVDSDPDDPEVGRLAEEARKAFRRYIRKSRSS